MGKLLRIGLPKGSLQDATLELFQRAGFRVTVSSRSYFPRFDDESLEAVMFRAQEMSRYVADGVIDAGLTGMDWVRENGSDVVDVVELNYSKRTHRPARWVLAVPNESPIRSVEQLRGKIIATELVNVTREFFAGRNIDVKVEFSWGATEVKARLVDAIVDITETGDSLRANELREVATVMVSTTHLIANRAAWADPWKREKIGDIATLLQAALAGREKVGLKMNVPRDKLAGVLALLPAEKSPTISPLADERFVAVEVVVDERTERELVLKLRKAGASGIITYALKKVIP